MPLILAIDPDKRQSTQLAQLVKAQLQAELVQRSTAGEALEALKGRVPDLVLTSSLISPREDAALATHLRELGTAGAHVQTVTIPLLGSAAPKRATGVLAALRREKPQAPMTDGCAPDVFAEQIRQYLATAEEQKAAAAIAAAQAQASAVAAPLEAEPREYVEVGLQTRPSVEAEPPAYVEAPTESIETPHQYVDVGLETRLHESVDAEAVEEWPDVQPPEPAAEALASFDSAWVAPESPVFVETAPQPEPEALAVAPQPPDAEPEAAGALEADEPAGLPLSQLLQLVSDTPPRARRAKVAEAATADTFITDHAPTAVPSSDIQPAFEPTALVEDPGTALHDAEATATRVADFGELPMDPVAAQALDELSRQAPSASLADGIPAEAPVPVVEMRTFDSLDSIANQLAAGPAPKYDNLDDLASLFAATPAPRHRELESAAPFEAPSLTGTHGFESLFAAPAPKAPAAPIDVPGIDPSLFAAPPARAPLAEPSLESLFVKPAADVAADPIVLAEPALPEPALLDAARFEPITGEPALAEPAMVEFVLPAVAAPAATDAAPIVLAHAEPTLDTPVHVEPELGTRVLVEPPQHAPEPVEPALAAALVPEPAAEPPLVVPEVSAAAPEWPEFAAFEPAPVEQADAEPAPVEFELPEPIEAAAAAEPAVAELQADAASVDFDEEIALDVDAFDLPAPVAEPAAKADTRFAFTLVDGFGDAWADFEVQAAASPAPGPSIDTDWFTAATQPAASTQAESKTAAPVLDDEALSMIGDAARKAGLDALVIEEFERGVRTGVRKAKPKKVPAAPAPVAERPAKKKGPVQDEWGLFDPEQCGFAALEDEDTADRRPRDGNTRVRVISY